MTNLIKHPAQPGETIFDTAERILFMAKVTGQRVISQHNQYVLVADPGNTACEVVQEWNEARRRSYFGGDR